MVLLQKLLQQQQPCRRELRSNYYYVSSSSSSTIVAKMVVVVVMMMVCCGIGTSGSTTFVGADMNDEEQPSSYHQSTTAACSNNNMDHTNDITTTTTSSDPNTCTSPTSTITNQTTTTTTTTTTTPSTPSTIDDNDSITNKNNYKNMLHDAPKISPSLPSDEQQQQCIDRWYKTICLERKVKGYCIVQRSSTNDDDDDSDDDTTDDEEELLLVEETLKYCLETCGVCALLNSTEMFGERQDLPYSSVLGYHNNNNDVDDDNQITSMIEYVDELRTMISYMKQRQQLEEDEGNNEDNDDDELLQCINDDKDCLLNIHYCINGDEVTIQNMIERCSPTCNTCHLMNDRIKCKDHWLPNGIERIPSLNTGDLYTIFKRIAKAAEDDDDDDESYTSPSQVNEEEEEEPTSTSSRLLYKTNNATWEAEWFDYVKKLQPVIHSRPRSSFSNVLDDSIDDNDDETNVVDNSNKPWIVTFENFLTPEEAQIFIDLGYEQGYERSGFYSEEPDENGMYDDTTIDDFRTSENTWYKVKGGHELAKQVMERIGYVVGIQPNYAEDYQLLKYEIGQHYGYHHDYHEDLLKSPCGPRILTFFLYLNDMTDDDSGGGTRFTDLDNLTIQPKLGRAVLWPNVMNDDPMEMEEWTFHEAMPVLKGQKFGSNIWYHLYDYQTPMEDGC